MTAKYGESAILNAETNNFWAPLIYLKNENENKNHSSPTFAFQHDVLNLLVTI